MENNWWLYLIPFCLAVIGLTQAYCNHHKETTEQVEEPAEVIKTVVTEQKKTEVPVGKIKCVHININQNFCSEYVIYRTIGE